MSRSTRPRRSAAGGAERNAPFRRRVIAALAAATIGLVTLSGCAAGQIAQSVDQVPNHDGGQGRVGPIGVHNVLIAGPDQPDGAVAYPKGSSSVPLTFWITNDADRADTLTQVTTPIGSVSLNGQAQVDDGSALQVGTHTSVTATITKTGADIKYGFPTTVVFHFANAGTVTIRVPVAIPPERETPRASTNIYPSETPNVFGY